MNHTRMSRIRRFVHVVGIDDAPFPPGFRGDVTVIAAVMSHARLDGVLTSKLRKDGINATDRLIAMIGKSRFYDQLHLVMLQGIAFGGFNVVDLPRLAGSLRLPVMAVCRRKPDMVVLRNTLMQSVPGGAKKWRLMQRAGPPHSVDHVYVQYSQLTPDEADGVVRALSIHSRVPEPLRLAHLIAGGLSGLPTRQRV